MVGTSSGLYVRRAIRVDGTPECVPFPAYEMLSHEIDRGAVDFASLRAAGATFDDLNPSEFERFRTMTKLANTDSPLAELSDMDICRALRILRISDDGIEQPTLGAVLLFGRQEALAHHVPNHESAFQVLDGLRVTTNEIWRGPLFETAEHLFDRVASRVREEELEMGLLRIAIPSIPKIAARESMANALVHRDYTAVGTVRVEINDDAFSVTSPGGFPPGVRLDNLLDVTQPRSPILADAFRLAGIVERTGRGVNQMFASMLRIGREAPDYSRTTPESVKVVLPMGTADLEMARLVLQQESRTGRPMRLFDLRLIHDLRLNTKSTGEEVARNLHLTEGETRVGLSRMVEDGLIEARGSGRGRSFHLASSMYKALDKPSAYVRVRGTDPIQQKQMISQYVDAYGSITRAQAADLCRIEPTVASTVLRSMARNGELVLRGSRRTSHYVTTDAGDPDTQKVAGSTEL